MAQVNLYTTPTCTYCKTVKQFFEANHVEYVEYDVSRDIEKAQHMVDKSGQTGVPVIEIDNEIIIGFDKRRLASALGID
ncbi:MAG: NrdH-redoxin [Candidatus Fraserbacteria bacterium RBG_16_55_9]|uniref:NrdH-redoxin n=1 Tax=Fraserbacteria sp. (strain RBG_16_55_9) TaxID=1817864 RepID=A0A1F5V0I8_FRAXR|nr:MAG: NrdH-redoxin [Candidatus Fraserbacteria bacterium RBG_16_55_9]